MQDLSVLWRAKQPLKSRKPSGEHPQITQS